MIELLRTDAKNLDFVKLVKKLDEELAVRDGDEHDFYDQFNKIDKIKYVIVAFDSNEILGCGAIKSFDTESMEVKRMYTTQEARGKGVATKILTELEHWTRELGFHSCILETGINQPEAINLYKKCGYMPIENYGQYAGKEMSRCFLKKLQ